MTRKKSDRWQALRKIADQYEQRAARSLGQSQGNLTQQRQRLEELLHFRQEYHTQFLQSGSQGMDGTTLQSFQRFLAQLDQAIAQQRRTVTAAELDCDNKRDVWQDKHKTTSIYDKTIERAVSEETRKQARKEQRESDDRIRRESQEE